MDDYILRLRTESSHEIVRLISVLKDVMHDGTFIFVRSTKTKKNKQKKSNDNLSDVDKNKKNTKKSKSDSEESESEEEQKKPKKKQQAKKVGKQSKSESSESESEDDKKKYKKKPAKKTGKKSKSDSSESEEESEDDKKKSKKKDSKKTKSDDSESEEEQEESEEESDGEKDEGGVKLLAVDNRQTLLVYVKLYAEQFSEFYVKPQQHTITIDLKELDKFMKTVQRDDIMTIQIENNDEQNITFILENNLKKTSTFYEQKLLDAENNQNQLPENANFEMYVTMDTSDFKKICSEMSQFSEFVEIKCTSKEITYACLGDNNRFFKTFKNSDEGVTITCNKKTKGLNMVQAIYDLKNLATFGKCGQLSSEMQLYLKNNYPLFLHYQVGNLGKMLVGLTPVDAKTIKGGDDYDDKFDDLYASKTVKIKNT